MDNIFKIKLNVPIEVMFCSKFDEDTFSELMLLLKQKKLQLKKAVISHLICTASCLCQETVSSVSPVELHHGG